MHNKISYAGLQRMYSVLLTHQA